MFEQDLKDFIAAEVAAGRLLSADLTGINEVSRVGEAKGYIINAEGSVDEKMFFFNEKNGAIVYHILNKLPDPVNPIPPTP